VGLAFYFHFITFDGWEKKGTNLIAPPSFKTQSLLAERFLSLTSELVLLIVIACREVEGNKAGYPGS